MSKYMIIYIYIYICFSPSTCTKISQNFLWQAKRWWASWQGGIEALPAPGHGCLTAFQSLERHNGCLKQSLPWDYHRLGMVAVNDRLLAGARALQKSRGWVTTTEQLPDQVEIRGHKWPGACGPLSVNKKILAGDWLSTGRLDWMEDRLCALQRGAVIVSSSSSCFLSFFLRPGRGACGEVAHVPSRLCLAPFFFLFDSVPLSLVPRGGHNGFGN